MKQTYEEAITQVFADEGGYSNDAGDPGGPTNWGITIADARMYWKSTATASDVRNMPKSIAEDIYVKHYATPLRYNDLPSGVDYAVLDYGVNSGISRAAKVLQRLVGVPIDGIIGNSTLAAVYKQDSKVLINKIYDERLAFLRSLGIWSTFGKGWTRRCTGGRKLALSLVDKYPFKQPSRAPEKAAGALISAAGTGVALAHWPSIWPYLAVATVVLVGIAIYYIRKHYVANSKTVVK